MKTLVAGIVAGIVVFLWGFISHTLLPTGEMGLKTIPGEDAVIGAMRQAIHEPGVYFFPGIDMKKKPTDAEQKAWMAKIKAGPTGLLVYRTTGEAFSPRQLVTELVTNILAALIAALVISRVAGGFGTRVLFTMLLGVFAWLSISLSYWNWYGFSKEFTTAELVDQLGGWLFAGLVIAGMTRRRVA